MHKKSSSFHLTTMPRIKTRKHYLIFLFILSITVYVIYLITPSGVHHNVHTKFPTNSMNLLFGDDDDFDFEDQQPKDTNKKILEKNNPTILNSVLLEVEYQKLLNKKLHIFSSFLSSTSTESSSPKYLINTDSCRLADWPLFDQEIFPLFESFADKTFDCDKNEPPFEIKRVNSTWIEINYPKVSNITDGGWECFAWELKSSNDLFEWGGKIGPLGRLNNFANNLTDLGNEPNSRWDSVKVFCKQLPDKKVEYSLAVPLVQQYKPTTKTHNSTTTNNPQVNVMLLGLDSISRLNFLRHMNKTRNFLESHNFIPLEGYHKVGENSFPNIISILTGNWPEAYYNQSMGDDVKFDDVPMIWKDFQRMGYVTTFVEDMPPYGIFSERGGFRKQPTDYYLRPMNVAVWNELYNMYTCYQKWLEHEIYWDFLLDQFEAFKVRGNLPHFTMAHLSTLTHDYFNNPGYADRYYHKFIEKIFIGNYHENSLIILFSDHGLRFGDAVNTTASTHEQRLPFIYIYVPESLVLNGKNASELREILKLNRNRLTSHIDLHATMLHVLYGKIPEVEPYGLSLFNEILSNRTCAQAGIKLEYCLCNSYNPIPVNSQVHNTSMVVLEHMNQLMSSYGNYCVPLTLNTIYRALGSVDDRLSQHYRIVHFMTDPNDAIIEGIVKMNGSVVASVENMSRLSRYGSKSSCVEHKYYDIVPFCYCWDIYEEDRKNSK